MQTPATIEREVPNLLTRNPEPNVESEDLLGFVLRLSDDNGYSTPWSLYRRAGLKQYEARGTGFNLDKLASIANCSVSKLEKIAYSCRESLRACSLLGHHIIPSDLDLANPRICPACIQNLRYIQAHWALRLMTGCPVHGRVAVNRCGACGEELSWYRPGLLECRCGATLENGNCRELIPAEASLLNLIRSKALRLLPLVDSGSQLPASDLSKLPLRKLLFTIAALGRCQILITMADEPTDDADVVSSAATVLSDWPDNYFELLKALGSRDFEGKYDIRRQFSPLYGSLLRADSSSDDTHDLDFLRLAFLDFVSNRWGLRAADSKLMKELQDQVGKRFLARAELARKLNVHQRTIKRLTDDGGSTASSGRAVLDGSQFSFSTPESRRILNISSAAAMVCVPVSVFRVLKERGVYRVKHMILGQVGFHELDLLCLRDRIVGAASQGVSRNEVISFAETMKSRCFSLAEKAALIDGLLADDLPAYIREEEGEIGQICMGKEQLFKFFGDLRNASPVVNALEAAELIDCGCEAVRELIANGTLKGAKKANGWEISRASIEEFKRSYVKISVIAESLGTSARRVIHVCALRHIALLQLGAANRRTGGFVLADRREQILRALGRQPKQLAAVAQ